MGKVYKTRTLINFYLKKKKKRERERERRRRRRRNYQNIFYIKHVLGYEIQDYFFKM